jgi:hypothetical protein
MASKRKSDTDPVASSGAAPARAKEKVTRRHQVATSETSAPAVAVQPAVETPAAKAPEAPASRPTLEEIAQLAYSYWEARGYQGGSQEEDWLRAERELNAQSLNATVA